jgi:hypothetical protein
MLKSTPARQPVRTRIISPSPARSTAIGIDLRSELTIDEHAAAADGQVRGALRQQ